MIVQKIKTPTSNNLVSFNGKVEQKTTRTRSPVVREEILSQLENKFLLRGHLIMPCIPSMLDYYFQPIHRLFETLAITPTPDKLKYLHQQIIEKINQGFQESPHSKIRITYETTLNTARGLIFKIGLINYSVVEQYQDWLKNRQPPYFGTHPDAKLMEVAASLQQNIYSSDSPLKKGGGGGIDEPPDRVPVLDIGAGTGRNTIPLAKLGYPVDAIELTPEFAEQIRESAKKSQLPVRVIQGNVLDSRQVKLRPAHYKLILISEVISHLRSPQELRQLLATMSDLLCSGGLLLFNGFLPIGNYEPNQIAREIGQSEISSIFTREELAWAMEKLPLEIISDESAFEYEKQHQPIEAWPPTGWYCDWATGRDVFWKSINQPPIELRWLLCRRR